MFILLFLFFCVLLSWCVHVIIFGGWVRSEGIERSRVVREGGGGGGGGGVGGGGGGGGVCLRYTYAHRGVGKATKKENYETTSQIDEMGSSKEPKTGIPSF